MGEKIMFFVIPEMPSKTFVMVLKKNPDHFKVMSATKALTVLEFISSRGLDNDGKGALLLANQVPSYRKFGKPTDNHYHMPKPRMFGILIICCAKLYC